MREAGKNSKMWQKKKVGGDAMKKRVTLCLPVPGATQRVRDKFVLHDGPRNDGDRGMERGNTFGDTRGILMRQRSAGHQTEEGRGTIPFPSPDPLVPSSDSDCEVQRKRHGITTRIPLSLSLSFAALSPIIPDRA